MKVTRHTATDGRRCISVVLLPERPETDTPQVEAIFRVHTPQDFTIKGEPYVLVPLSTTRTDTRESFTLDPSEFERVLEEAASFVAKLDLSEDW